MNKQTLQMPIRSAFALDRARAALFAGAAAATDQHCDDLCLCQSGGSRQPGRADLTRANYTVDGSRQLAGVGGRSRHLSPEIPETALTKCNSCRLCQMND